MSNISELSSGISGTYENPQVNKTEKTYGNYGKTIGKAKLSEEGAKYYEELKKKFSGMDFVLVSADMKDYAKQNASSYGNANRMVVLIDEEKIERMATDSEYRAKYEGLIAQAQNKMPELKSIMQTKGNVKTIGMQVEDNGTASFFAVMRKSSQEMTEKLAEKRAEKKAEEKAAKKAEAKKEAKEEQLEKIQEKSADTAIDDEEDYVILMASSVEDLIKKIDDYNFAYRADTIKTPYEKTIGQTIDFKG